jgi:hypothetical protein
MISSRPNKANLMETNPSLGEMDNESFISFLNKLNSALPESISGGDHSFMTEEKNSPFALLQNG